MNRRQAAVLALASLSLAVLACDTSSGPGPDTAATVNALNIFVAETLTAKANLTATAPELTPTPLAGPAPQDTQPASPSELPAEASPAVSQAPARPNGDVVHAAAAATSPQIDGDLSDWPALPYQGTLPTYKPEAWGGTQDNSFNFGLQWDANYLYVAAAVVDDVHVQTQHNEMIYKGDSLELLFDADLQGDFDVAHLDADDYQLGLSPGALNGDSPEAWLWFPASQSGAANNVKLAAKPDGQGYRLEAAIPWALFNVSPAGGSRFGFVISSSDDDSPDTAQQKSMVSNVGTRKLLDPTSWGTLALDP